MTRGRLLLCALWLATAIAAGALFHWWTGAGDTPHEFGARDDGQPSPGNAPRLTTPARDVGAPVPKTPDSTDTATEPPSGAGAWIAVRAPLDAQGDRVPGTAYVLPAGEAGGNDLAAFAHRVVESTLDAPLGIPVPTEGSYDVGFVPRDHTWWTLRRDVIAQTDADTVDPVALKQPSRTETLRLDIDRTWPEEVVRIDITVKSAEASDAFDYPGREDTRRVSIQTWTKESGRLDVCECAREQGLRLEAHCVSKWDAPQPHAFAVLSPEAIHEERLASLSFRKLVPIRLVVPEEGRPFQARLTSSNAGDWRTSKPGDDGRHAIMLWVRPGTHRAHWIVDDLEGTTPEIPTAVDDVAEFVVNVARGRARVSDDASPVASLTMQIGGLDEGEEADVVAIDAKRRTSESMSQALVGSDSGNELPLSRDAPHIAVAVWVDAMDTSVEPLASDYRRVRAGIEWKAVLKPAGYCHVVTRRRAPPGAAELRLVHASGGPLPRVGVGDEATGVMWFPFVALREPTTIGPLAQGNHSLELFAGRRKLRSFNVTIVPGETSVLVVP